MSNEQQLPTCLVALRAEIGSTLVETERRLEHRVVQVEQAFSSLGWESDQLRANLKQADTEAARLQEQLGRTKETNQALLARIEAAEVAWTRQNIELNQARDEIRDLREVIPTLLTPQQCADQVNKVHDELIAKLSAERSELETVQKLLQQARLERDEARLSRQALLLEHRGVKNLNRAQGERIAAAAAGLDAMAGIVKDLQNKLDDSEQRRMQTEDDFGKLVGEHEDHVKKHEVLRNLLMGNDPTPDCDRYTAFAIAMGTDRHTAKMAVHRFVKEHPVCKELQTQVDVLCKRLEEDKPRVTQAEMLHQFKGEAFKILECVINLTTKDVSALQYGPQHGHRRLHALITAFRRKFAPCFGEDEVLR